MADNKVVIEFVPDTTKLESAFQNVQKEAQKTGQVSATAFQQFNAENKKAAESVKQTATESQKLNDQFREITKTIAAEVINEVAIAAKEASENYLSLRTQLANAKEALFKLGEEGKKGTAEWNNQIKIVSKLSTEYKELQKTVNNLGSSTKVLSGLLEATRGVVAGFEIAKGATAFFGGENKNLEKTIKELAGAMAILQGLQEVQNLLEADSAAILLIENGQRLAGVAATKLQTLAESEYVIVSKAAAAAQWALNAAMNANPIMILVGAIGAAVAALLYFTSTTEDADEATVKFNEDLGKLNDTVQKGYVKRMQLTGELTEMEARALEINAEASKKSLAVIVEYNKKAEELLAKRPFGDAAIAKRDAQVVETFKQRTELLAKIEEDRQLQIADIRLEALDKLAEKEAEKNLREEQKYNEHLRNLQKMREEYIKNQLEGYDEATKKLNEALIAQGDNTGLTTDERIQYYFLGGLTKEEIAKKLSEVLSEADKQAAEIEGSRIKNQNATNAAFKNQLREDTQKNNDKKAAEQLALDKQIASATLQVQKELFNELFQLEAENNQRKLDEALRSIEAKRQKELANKELTESQKEAINKKYARLEAEAKRRAWEADKQAKIGQAVINTLLAVTQALATLSPPYSYVVAATSAALGAVQVSLIAAQKAPQFAKGTKGSEVTPKGFKWVGEEGPELIHTPGGEKIITHGDSMKILENYNLPAAPSFTPPIPQAPDLSGGGNVIVQQGIDYNKLGSVIAQKLKENPQTVMKLDRGGFSLHVIEKGSRVEKLNNRYES